MSRLWNAGWPWVVTLSLLSNVALGQSVTVDASPAGRRQIIDGFGTALNERAQESWYQALLLDDLQASIARMDITPRFAAPYSDAKYYSPWFGPPIELPGPDRNSVRTYTGPSDYSRPYGTFRAPIAVMGPDIDANIAMFDFGDVRPASAGALASAAQARKAALGDFKLFGSIFSPAPWLKIASGTQLQEGGDGVLPAFGTRFPFIWNGNFAGGRLDVSGTPLAVFHDGTGPTSALTQFARSTAAYLRGFQRRFGVSLYAVSIQNELGFEQFYDSCGYPLASQLAAALKALRAELDKYPDLAPIKLIGPEDLLIDTPYSLWQFGSNAAPVHKNLRYLHEMRASDPAALAALGFVAVHGAPGDRAWQWWAQGWSATPEGTLPASLAGFTSYGLKSWMTETSGDTSSWPRPTDGGPDRGALNVATHIHRALTSGQESAWVYWQLADKEPVGPFTLTDAQLGASAPKYVAAKHFFRPIRPGAQRVEAAVAGAPELLASAYLHEQNGTVTVVLINTASAVRTTSVSVSGTPAPIVSWQTFSSSADAAWQTSAPIRAATASVSVPAYGIVTLQGSLTPPSTPGGAAPNRVDIRKFMKVSARRTKRRP